MQEEITSLFENQIEGWQLLNGNYSTYEKTLKDKLSLRDCSWNGTKILLNYRKASLSANLKAIAEGQRPCFLCANARPGEQQAVNWNNYEILCNPYPASAKHFTIVCRDHKPQHLGLRIIDMSHLVKLMPDCCIFYNGPKCGASAPDHMHFQAVNRDEAVNFMLTNEYMTEILAVGDSRLYVPNPASTPFGYFIIDFTQESDIQTMFETLLHTLPRQGDEEPMINVVAFRFDNSTRIIVIPRKNHRPKCYGVEPGQMLISPASLEMMGKIITSRREDYDRLDGDTMQQIYHEVAYTPIEILEFVQKQPLT